MGLFFVVAAFVVFPKTLLLLTAGATFGVGAAPVILLGGTTGGILAFAFKAGLFRENFWGGLGMPQTSLFEQVRATMLVTVFVFLGIEGASVYSRYAKQRSDVGRATIT